MVLLLLCCSLTWLYTLPVCVSLFLVFRGVLVCVCFFGLVLFVLLVLRTVWFLFVFSFENKTNLFHPKICFLSLFFVSLPFSFDCLSLVFSLFSFFLICFHEQKQNSKLERFLSSMFLFRCFGRVIHLTLEPSIFKFPP